MNPLELNDISCNSTYLDSMSESILNEMGTLSDLNIWRDLPA